MNEQTNEMTVRVKFIDGTERIVPAKDFHWVGEEGAQSATAIVDGREVPIYRRAEPEWGDKWVEQMDYEQWKAQQRAEQLEQLLRETLLYLKSIAPYSYSNAPRAVDLLDRAAELGIIPEVPHER